MAATGWNAGSPVTGDDAAQVGTAADERRHELAFEKVRSLFDNEVFRVEFFQAVRLLEQMETERGPVGYFVTPGSEAVRFSALTSLSFPASQLYQMDRGPDGQPRLVVQFMGLCASVTILPHVYTEYLLVRLKEKDTAMAEFFDMFNHRMISLFYRGWEKYRFFVGYETKEVGSITPRMMDLLGLGTEGLSQRSLLPDRAFLYYSGLLGGHNRSAAALKQILEDYFQVSITIVQFAGTWRYLPAVNQTVLEGSNRSSERLGIGTVVGSEVWDHHGRIRISIGPMGFDQYVSFLPGYGAHRDLEAWVKFYSNGQYEAEVQLILNRGEAPPCELGLRGKQEPRLGMASWLKTKPLVSDPGDAVFLLT
jgi:type VI secretion system protein ImpH